MGGIGVPIVAHAQAESSISLALLHLAPQPGEVEANMQMIERAALRAARNGAKLIVTPELALSGYGFRDVIGTEWIARGQAARLAWAGGLARRVSAFLVIGMPEADGDRLFNSMILFAPDGGRLGHHRKINVLKVGSESWSVPGGRATALAVEGIGRLGLFVCADMYSQRLVRETVAQDVDLLLSSAAWAPGEHGPNGEWERASLETGRPVLVCNRTGTDVLDFNAAQSVSAIGGALAASHRSPAPAVILVDWSPRTRRLANWRVSA